MGAPPGPGTSASWHCKGSGSCYAKRVLETMLPYGHAAMRTIYSHASSPLKALISGLAFALFALPPSGWAEPAHGIAMHGESREPAGFSHFPYANPDAP